MDIVKSASENQKKEEEITLNKETSKWHYMLDSILLTIFQYLTLKELIIAGEVCKSWHRVSHDDFLWKNLFYQAYDIDPSVGMMPGKTSWFQEFKRLTYRIPLIATEQLTKHKTMVIHVSFSHNGKMFATCSWDICIIVWKSQYPVKIKYEYNMKSFGWRNTRFSQFNSSDTLLLVSGTLHPGCDENHVGEIAVFSLTPDFKLQFRVMNTPFSILGTWYTEQYFLSGSLYWHSVDSEVAFWLNKKNLELSSGNKPIITQLSSFPHNCCHREIIVANCLTSELPEDVQQKNVEDSSSEVQSVRMVYLETTNSPTILREFLLLENCQLHKENIHIEENVAEIVNCCEKYVIFTNGTNTHIPHEVAFKRIKNVKSPGRIYKVDHVIDLRGCIVGMALSPDHRYLYVNVRPWEEGVTYRIGESPSVAKEIEIRVIDLVTLKEVGRMSKTHTAYLDDYCSIEFNFSYLIDVCDEYVASCAADSHGYLWDRYYGVPLVKFKHFVAVKSVAINPRDPEMLVTTSNDGSIKVWRSRSKVYKLGLNKDSYPKGAEIQNRKRRRRNKHRKASNSDLPNIIYNDNWKCS